METKQRKTHSPSQLRPSFERQMPIKIIDQLKQVRKKETLLANSGQHSMEKRWQLIGFDPILGDHMSQCSWNLLVLGDSPGLSDGFAKTESISSSDVLIELLLLLGCAET